MRLKINEGAVFEYCLLTCENISRKHATDQPHIYKLKYRCKTNDMYKINSS